MLESCFAPPRAPFEKIQTVTVVGSLDSVCDVVELLAQKYCSNLESQQ
jgi:hypothetical protein